MQLYDALKGDLFVQIHRSYIVSLSKVTLIKNNGVHIKNGVILPIPKGTSKQIKEKYIRYLNKGVA